MLGIREFSRVLRSSGLSVESVHPCDLEWGEVGQFLYRRFGGARSTPHGSPGPAAPPAQAAGSPQGSAPDGGLRTLWRDVFVSEQPRQPWLRPVLQLLNHLSGHMVLFVCRPVK